MTYVDLRPDDVRLDQVLSPTTGGGIAARARARVTVGS